jgi:DNA-binding transcriptional ArsR family regulator
MGEKGSPQQVNAHNCANQGRNYACGEHWPAVMTLKILYARERAAMARMVIALMRNTNTAYFPDMRLNDAIDLRYVATYVFLGHVEGRLMNVSKLARALGMPRATVLRKLGVLMKIGYVERVGRSYRVTEKANLPNLLEVVARNAELIKATTKELSKMRIGE